MLKSLEFSEDRLELGRVIGQGAYGIVVKGEGELDDRVTSPVCCLF